MKKKLLGSLAIAMMFSLLLVYPPQTAYSAGGAGCKECKESLNSPGQKSCQTPVTKKAQCGDCNKICVSGNQQ